MATTLVLLGASGDLTERLLLPGLGTLLATEPTRRVELVGAAQDDWSDERWRDLVRAALAQGGAAPEVVEATVATTRYVRLDVLDRASWTTFVAGLPEGSVLYFALPPQVTVDSCRLLDRAALPPGVRLALEKPFGYDLASARDFNDLLAGLVPEDRVFRVDHFLGNATVLNILGLRFANRILEPMWTARDIDRVEIVADETLALEGRAGYYDGTGAMVDMLQSHLLLILALAAMEEPNRIDAVELRDLMAHLLRATEAWGGDPVASSRRARYLAGRVGERDVPDYTAEPGVDPDRNTETLAELAVEIHSSRWKGVPFLLRSGKALGADCRHVAVHFRPVAHQARGFTNEASPNVLIIGMTPERLVLKLSTNGAGDKFSLEQTVFEAHLGDSPVRPYGEILAGILDGDPLLAVRGDVAEECWRIVEPFTRAWSTDIVPLEEYRTGSGGPQRWAEEQLIG